MSDSTSTKHNNRREGKGQERPDFNSRIRNLDDFLLLLKGVKSGKDGQYTALCPGHDDRNRSLSVKQADGKLLVKCFAGCATANILKPLNLEQKDLFLNSRKAGPEHREIVAVYYYDGFEVVRTRPKGFYQRRPDGKGGYINNLKGITPTLYHQNELPRAITAGTSIFIAEGEKDIDRLRAEGFTATCNPMGAGKWRDSYSEALRGADVVIIPDNDGPGRDHAAQVARSCYGKAARLRILELPDAKDVSEWLAAGGTTAELERLTSRCPDYEPPHVNSNESGLDTDQPVHFHLTDLGNAERLASQNQGRVRYCWDVSKWLIWNGQVWQWDEGPRIKVIAKQTARNIYHEAAEPGLTEAMAERIAKHAHASESESRLSAMIALAQAENGIPVKLSELNVHPWLLNCKNGTIDLKTGMLLPHNATDLITLQVPVEYTPDAECPNWVHFLGLVTSHDLGLQAYLQKAVGYSLTGNTGAQVLFLLYGLGGNGKGTFTNTIRAILDGYACRLDAEDLMLSDHYQKSGPKEGIAALQGARFAVGSEIQDGRQLNTSLIKDITGQDSIKARRLYAHEVEFTPQCKLWLYGNHKPTIKDTTLSIWRRMKLILFGFTIGESERIDDYAERYLKPEWAGILAWAVKGSLLWQQEGLKDADSVRSATANYRADEDILGDYLADSCIMEHGATIPKADMKALYSKWCEDNKADPVTQKTFKTRLIEKGITDGVSSDGKKRIWRGIRARGEGDPSDISDRSCQNSYLSDKTILDLPKLSLENTTRKKTLQENGSEMSVLSDTPGQLPDCPDCGRNEWEYTPDGDLSCPCGHQLIYETRLPPQT